MCPAVVISGWRGERLLACAVEAGCGHMVAGAERGRGGQDEGGRGVLGGWSRW